MHSDAYRKADNIGAKGEILITDYLQRRRGTVINTRDLSIPDKRRMQTTQHLVGDLLVCKPNVENPFTVEVKTERKTDTECLFVEFWSNRIFRRQTVGWGLTCAVDYLAYLFLDMRKAYFCELQKLWEHLWVHENHKRYALKPQTKYEQDNDAYGLLVPIERLLKVKILEEISQDIVWQAATDGQH